LDAPGSYRTYPRAQTESVLKGGSRTNNISFMWSLSLNNLCAFLLDYAATEVTFQNLYANYRLPQDAFSLQKNKL